MKNPILTLVIFFFLLNVSCATDNTCIQSKYVKLTAGFYHVRDTLNNYSITSLNIDSLTVQGLKYDSASLKYVPVDSILYNKTSANSINLPLNNFAPQSVFKIKFNTLIDTMTIIHKNLNDYLSLECGCIVTHSIDTVLMTKHYIDSVRIIIHDVNTLNVENIRLYNSKLITK